MAEGTADLWDAHFGDVQVVSKDKMVDLVLEHAWKLTRNYDPAEVKVLSLTFDQVTTVYVVDGAISHGKGS